MPFLHNFCLFCFNFINKTLNYGLTVEFIIVGWIEYKIKDTIN